MNQNDPYQILGVSPQADDDEIKRAYHELARKYHPDRYSNSDFAELAKEKMQAINAAYEEIQRRRAAGASAGTGGGYKGGSDAGAYGAPNGGGAYYSRYSAEAQEKFLLIRSCLRSGNVTEAERLLYEVAEIDRGAEWYFLLGHIQLHKGAHMDAQHSFETAYRMEPNNNEYWQAKERANQQARQYGAGYNTTQRGGGCDCDMCSTLICADCCCECMGGDLIPCC